MHDITAQADFVRLSKERSHQNGIGLIMRFKESCFVLLITYTLNQNCYTVKQSKIHLILHYFGIMDWIPIGISD